MQLVLAHLSDEHLEQAADHEQCIVGLPDKELTVEEEEAERCDRIMRNHTVVKHQNEDVKGYLQFPKLEFHTAATLWPMKAVFISPLERWEKSV